MSKEKLIIAALTGALTAATAIIVANQVEIEELHAELATQRRHKNIFKKTCFALINSATREELLNAKKLLKEEIAFENIIKDF